MNRRLTYRRNGRWFYANRPGRRPVQIKPLRVDLHFFRACDRVFVGRDNGRNHW